MNTRVRLVPAEWKHINRIAASIRAIDAEECRAMGREPKQAMRLAFMTSEKAWTALVDGVPHAMFGVVVESLLDRIGTPWFLGTDEVYRHAREMMQWGPGILSRMGDSSRRLSNLVSSDNHQAIRLLRKWGFSVANDEVIVRGVAFRQFERIA